MTAGTGGGFFDWVQLAAVGSLLGLGIGRGVLQYARGVRVVVADRERSLAQGLTDLLFIVCFLTWIYESVAYAWPLPTHVAPKVLGTVLVDAVAVRAAGAAVLCAGLVIYALALRTLGDSWRLGIDRDVPGVLVTGGIFAWTRNPIYVGLDLLAIGTFLVQGRLTFLILALAIVTMIDNQIRREERFLASTFGEAYREYCECTGRYVTWRRR